MLVNQGQLELKYTETKERPGKVRTDAVLQGMNLVQAYNGTEMAGRFSHSKAARIRKKCRRTKRSR